MLCTPGTRRSAGLRKTELRGRSNPIRAVMLPEEENVPNNNRWPSHSTQKIPSGPGGSRMHQELCRAAKASKSRNGLRRASAEPVEANAGNRSWNRKEEMNEFMKGEPIDSRWMSGIQLRMNDVCHRVEIHCKGQDPEQGERGPTSDRRPSQTRPLSASGGITLDLDFIHLLAAWSNPSMPTGIGMAAPSSSFSNKPAVMFKARPGLEAAAWTRLDAAWASDILGPSPSPQAGFQAQASGLGPGLKYIFSRYVKSRLRRLLIVIPGHVKNCTTATRLTITLSIQRPPSSSHVAGDAADGAYDEENGTSPPDAGLVHLPRPQPPPTPSHPPSSSRRWGRSGWVYDEENDTSPPDAGPWPALFHAAFYAQVWRTYRAGFKPIRDLLSLSSLPPPFAFPCPPPSPSHNTLAESASSAVVPTSWAAVDGGLRGGEHGRFSSSSLMWKIANAVRDILHPASMNVADSMGALVFYGGDAVRRLWLCSLPTFILFLDRRLDESLAAPRGGYALGRGSVGGVRFGGCGPSAKPPLISTLAPPLPPQTRHAHALHARLLMVPRRTGGAVRPVPHGAGGQGGREGPLAPSHSPAFAPSLSATSVSLHGHSSSSHGPGSKKGKESKKWGDRPVLPLLEIRLGLDGLLYTFPHSVGIAPNSHRLTRRRRCARSTPSGMRRRVEELPRTIFANADEPLLRLRADDHEMGLESIFDPDEVEEAGMDAGDVSSASHAPSSNTSHGVSTSSHLREAAAARAARKLTPRRILSRALRPPRRALRPQWRAPLLSKDKGKGTAGDAYAELEGDNGFADAGGEVEIEDNWIDPVAPPACHPTHE
ncbi:hypothetical protein B0H17DRAFT_1179233 [Mycena rosella]|uniref:Uncharacterized protein n=1 Tax=Mycena rosella TaxID=1033263 RepID=A0AAD7DM11_MYCRO|nr:hypothetical protein B0H17DRAFT_1179233 [Mycena rosella]